MSKDIKYQKVVLEELLEKVKEDFFQPYFTERAEEEILHSEFGIIEDLRDDKKRVVIDFLELRIIELEQEL